MFVRLNIWIDLNQRPPSSPLIQFRRQKRQNSPFLKISLSKWRDLASNRGGEQLQLALPKAYQLRTLFAKHSDNRK